MKRRYLTLPVIIGILLAVVAVCVSCGSSGGGWTVGPTWDLAISARLPDGVSHGEGTTLIFSILVHPNECTHPNSHGIQVPDSATFYPDGRGGSLAPVALDLESAVMSDGYTIFEVTYTYPEDKEYRAEAAAVHEGQTALSPPWSTHF